MILAAGLAYRTLFATLTLVAFAAGMVGVLIEDPARRVEVIGALVTILPGPLHASLTASIDTLGEAGLTIGVVGLVGLYWGASSLYDAIDQATDLVLAGGRRRSGLDRRLRGLVALAALIMVVVAFFALTALLPAIGLRLGTGGIVTYVVGPALAVTAVIALAYAGYRFLPTEPPSARDALPPAIVAGTAMSLLATFFAVLAPFLVSRLQAFGVVASFLAALAWLNYTAACFLVGAAWARARRDRRGEATRAHAV
jgi:uncharacterized BrkB/YihY/UPF0761 family membrane protein